MSKTMKRLLAISLVLSLIVGGIFIYGVGQEEQRNTTDKIYITVTTTFLGDAAEQIGGDHVNVTRLMGAGVDPHQYQASSSDLTKLTSADVVFYAGLHLEAKLGDVLEKLAESGQPIYNTSNSIPRSKLLYAEDLTAAEIAEMSEEDGVYDPHIWFDIDLWQLVVNEVNQALQEIDPANKQEYQTNYENYIKDLNELGEYVKNRVLELPESARYLVTAHDAFNYFSRYAGMSVRGIQGINTSVEAGTNDVSQTANFIVEHQIKAVFVESSVSPKLIQALQEAVDAKGEKVTIGGELFSDSTGSAGTAEGTYIGMYKHNIDTIVESLS